MGLNIDISAYAKGCYTVTVENGLESFTGQFVAQSTGTEEIALASLPSERRPHNASIYNLQGQRIHTLRKGLNIVNRQKVYVR